MRVRRLHLRRVAVLGICGLVGSGAVGTSGAVQRAGDAPSAPLGPHQRYAANLDSPKYAAARRVAESSRSQWNTCR
jgi:hypothetical protein